MKEKTKDWLLLASIVLNVALLLFGVFISSHARSNSERVRILFQRLDHHSGNSIFKQFAGQDDVPPWPQTAQLNPHEKGFILTSNTSGVFAVALDEVEQYANGSNLKFRLLPLLIAKYDDVQIVIKHHIKSYDFSLDTTVVPGRWTKFEASIPVTPNELDTFGISINCPSLSPGLGG